MTDVIFLDSKITVDGDCSHKIKRRLLLGRKVMTNLDNILKSRDITLPIKVYIVKAMVFLIVRYGCESWATKKAEHQRMDVFELWCWRRLLKSLLNSKDIKPVHPKRNQSWICIGRTDAGAATPVDHLMQTADWLEKTLMLGKIESRRRTRRQRMKWLDGLTDSVGISSSKVQETVKDREVWLAIVHGVAKKSNTT